MISWYIIIVWAFIVIDCVLYSLALKNDKKLIPGIWTTITPGSGFYLYFFKRVKSNV